MNNEFSEIFMDSEIDKDIERSRELVLSGRKLEREDLVEKLKAEVWSYHTISDLEDEYNISKELKEKLNAMFMKAHNEVLENFIKFYE